MRGWRAAVGLALAASYAPAVALAQDDTTAAVEAFYGACVAQGPDFDRTVAASKLFGWKALPAEMKTIVGPAGPTEAFEGWLAVGNPFPPKTVVGISKARDNGKPVHVCTLAFMDADGAAVERQFLSRMKPKKVGEESDGMQAFRVYTLTAGVSNKPQMITVTVPFQGPGIVLGSIMQK
jgi:hypothetical protein